ncbi:hypothetical protein B0H14DRAFT_2559136 [Mycena olivaceomarginata]|nr:hypothetical protein B0H14DRAFT_2559136 [Mycena olivaceomarginata]
MYAGQAICATLQELEHESFGSDSSDSDEPACATSNYNVHPLWSHNESFFHVRWRELGTATLNSAETPGDPKLEIPPPSLAQPSAPAADNDLDVYDIDNDVLALMDALERAEQLEIENRSLRDTIEDHQMLQQTMQADFEERERAYQADLDMMAASHEWTERENSYRAELELLQSTVQCLEDDLRASRVPFSPRSPVPRSQRPTSQARPPPTLLVSLRPCLRVRLVSGLQQRVEHLLFASLHQRGLCPLMRTPSHPVRTGSWLSTR